MTLLQIQGQTAGYLGHIGDYRISRRAVCRPSYLAQRRRIEGSDAQPVRGNALRFSALRNHCIMNFRMDLSRQGRIQWRDQPTLRRDIVRIENACDEITS